MKSEFDEPGQVRAGEELPVAAIEKYLSEKLGIEGPLEIHQFPSGYSNLTYFIRANHHEMVLRRPPFGNEVQSAHDMSREYRVLSGLWQMFPAAPRPLIFCEDKAILDVPFYVMERRKGIILRKQVASQRTLQPTTMENLCRSFVTTLADLHRVDFRKAGLGDLGKPEGYVGRQVAGWIKRYQNAQTEHVSAMDRMADWLVQNIQTSGRVALIHNDFKFDNLVLDPADPSSIVGVLDWEMATLGDPFMDLGTSLGYWVEANDPEMLQFFVVGPTNISGSWTRQKIVDVYQEITGWQTESMLFYYCFGLFKIAAIVQQIYARYAHGHTRDPRFAQLNQVVAKMAEGGVKAIEANKV